jgi:hypothetical protein
MKLERRGSKPEWVEGGRGVGDQRSELGGRRRNECAVGPRAGFGVNDPRATGGIAAVQGGRQKNKNYKTKPSFGGILMWPGAD